MSKTLDYESDVSEVEHPRLQACQALSLERLPCVIWGEDALAHHGVPTLVFDVFLLVHDPEKSAQALLKHGFERTAANPRFKRTPPLSTEAPRLAIPVPGDHSVGQDESELEADRQIGVVLLSAHRWRYDVPNTCGNEVHEFFPRMWDHLNSLISVYQDLGAEDYTMIGYVAGHIGYFYLYTNEVWEPGSEGNLLRENRQLHLDYLAGRRNVVAAASHNPVLARIMVRRDLPSSVLQQYYQNVRNMIREGKHTPVIAPNGVDKPPPSVKPGEGRD